MLDLKRKRDGEAVVVQARISDAVLRDPRLFSLPITPTARVPLWKGSPVTVEVAGQVPSDDLRQVALGVIEREATHLRPRCANRVPDRRRADHGSMIGLSRARRKKETRCASRA